jgi:hypothetical protein
MTRLVAANAVVFLAAFLVAAVSTAVAIPLWLSIAVIAPFLWLGLAFRRFLAAIDPCHFD